MYANVGLSTPRGSATSGFVQRNLSAVPQHLAKGDRRGKWSYQEFPDESKVVQRKPNLQILEHERKRQVEIKVLELEEELKSRKLPQEDIERRTDEYRTELLNKLTLDDAVRQSSDSHAEGARKQAENDRLRAAFKLKEGTTAKTAFERVDQASVANPRTKPAEDRPRFLDRSRPFPKPGEDFDSSKWTREGPKTEDDDDDKTKKEPEVVDRDSFRHTRFRGNIPLRPTQPSRNVKSENKSRTETKTANNDANRGEKRQHSGRRDERSYERNRNRRYSRSSSRSRSRSSSTSRSGSRSSSDEYSSRRRSRRYSRSDSSDSSDASSSDYSSDSDSRSRSRSRSRSNDRRKQSRSSRHHDSRSRRSYRRSRSSSRSDSSSSSRSRSRSRSPSSSSSSSSSRSRSRSRSRSGSVSRRSSRSRSSSPSRSRSRSRSRTDSRDRRQRDQKRSSPGSARESSVPKSM